jgi:hypothetical protein
MTPALKKDDVFPLQLNATIWESFELIFMQVLEFVAIIVAL